MCFLDLCPYFNKAHTKKGVFFYFCPNTKQSPTQKGVFLYFSPYPNQSLTRKGVFLYFTLILTKALPKTMFFSIFALTLIKVTELSILLTSCLTAIKNHVIKYCTTVYERNGKKLFWSIKSSGEILNKLKSRGFLASGLSTYDFSILYTTLPHNLIKEKLTELIEQTFNRDGSLHLACNDKNAFFLLLNNLNDINCGHVRKCVMRSIIFWTIYL